MAELETSGHQGRGGAGQHGDADEGLGVARRHAGRRHFVDDVEAEFKAIVDNYVATRYVKKGG